MQIAFDYNLEFQVEFLVTLIPLGALISLEIKHNLLN